MSALVTDRPVIRDGFVIPCNNGAGSVTCVHVSDVAAVTVLRSHQDTGGWHVTVARKTQPTPSVIVAITEQRPVAEALALTLMAEVAAQTTDLARRVERLERAVLDLGASHARALEVAS